MIARFLGNTIARINYFRLATLTTPFLVGDDVASGSPPNKRRACLVSVAPLARDNLPPYNNGVFGRVGEYD